MFEFWEVLEILMFWGVLEILTILDELDILEFECEGHWGFCWPDCKASQVYELAKTVCLSKKKKRWPPWPLIGRAIFGFSSESAERNSGKLDRKQDLNILYQVCVFWADWKNKMATLASDWLRHFSTSPLKPLNGIQRNLTGSKISTSSTKFVFFWPIGLKKMAALASDWLRHFRLYPLK